MDKITNPDQNYDMDYCRIMVAKYGHFLLLLNVHKSAEYLQMNPNGLLFILVLMIF